MKNWEKILYAALGAMILTALANYGLKRWGDNKKELAPPLHGGIDKPMCPECYSKPVHVIPFNNKGLKYKSM